jgi:hypothetical protein
MSLLLGKAPLEAFASSLAKKPLSCFSKKKGDAAFVYPLDLQAAKKEADEIRELLNALIPLFRSPRLENKRVELVLRQEESGPLGPEAIQATIRDTPQWRRKRGTFSPEYVHASYVEDQTITYENRFVCALLSQVEKDVRELARLGLGFEKNLRERFSGAGASYGPYGLYADLLREKAESSSLSEGEGLSTFLSDIRRLQGRVLRLKDTPFYREVSPHAFLPPVYPTNLLLHEAHYNAAFRYYRAHAQGGEETSDLDLLYRNYALARLLAFAVMESGKKPVLSYREGTLHFEPFTLSNNAYSYAFSEEGQDLLIRVRKEAKDGPEFAHRLHFAYVDEDALPLEQGPREENIRVVAFGGFDKDGGTLPLSPFEDAHSLLETFFASFRLNVPALSGERCPVCGNRFLHEEGQAYYCPQCHSSFAAESSKDSPHLWLGILGRAF